MANFNLVVDTSNFKPFDISPAMQILHDYRDAYYKLEDQMNKIAEEKGQYVLPDTPENQSYKNIMSKYNADYDAVVDDFSKGMNTENARKIREMRRRYHSEVSPINKAIEAYNKDLDKMVALGADAIVGNRKRSIQDYYGGLNPGIEYRSERAIQSTAAGVVQGLDNAFAGAPEKVDHIAKQYFVFKQRGLDGASALGEILKHDPSLNSQQGAAATTQLINALEKVYQHYAFAEGTPENKRVWDNVVTGAIQGIQAPKYSMQADHSYLNPAQKYALEQQRREDAFKFKTENGKIVGWNDKYLEGAYASSHKNDSAVTEYETVPSGGKFHPVVEGAAESQITSSSEVSRDAVPQHIAVEYPAGTKFYVGKNDAGEIIGYKAITYKKVKKGETTSDPTQTTGAGGTQTNEVVDLDAEGEGE